MTLPKGFKPKDTKKSKIEDSKSSKENNNKNNKNNADSNQIKVSRETTDDFVNKQENKIVADNIPHTEEVAVDDVSIAEGTATVSTVTTTSASEGEVLSETEMKVPLQDNAKDVISETEMKVMPSPSPPHDLQSSQSSLEKEAESAAQISSKLTQDDLDNRREKEKEIMQHITDNEVLLDETKNNIRRATDEARKDIPRYTQAANEYQEQTIQTAREIADNFLESQKEIINSLQSAWLPQIDAANRAFVSSWLSPRHIADNYARVVSSFVDNTIAATRVANNTVFANMDAFKTSIQNARDNVREFSRIGVNSARTFEQTSRDTTTRFSY
jgi:hypothetical protein